MKSGEAVVVTAAAGGTGQFAVQVQFFSLMNGLQFFIHKVDSAECDLGCV